MAEENEVIEGTVLLNGPVWRQSGVVVSNDLTAAQLLQQAGLDWTVEKHPLFAHVGTAEEGGFEIPAEHSALIRSSDNSILDIVSDDWVPTQNQEFADFTHEFVQAGGLSMDSAGSSRNGKYVWMIAKLNETFSVFGGDVIESYLLFFNPHQYGKTGEVRLVNRRPSCENMIQAILREASSHYAKWNHRHEFDAEAIKETMGLVHGQINNLQETIELLGSREAATDDVIEFFNKIFPLTSNRKGKESSRMAQRALVLMDSQPGAEYAAGSWWSAVNAVTYALTHEGGRNQENRLFNSWFGPNSNKGINAMALAREYADKSGSLTGFARSSRIALPAPQIVSEPVIEAESTPVAETVVTPAVTAAAKTPKTKAKAGGSAGKTKAPKKAAAKSAPKKASKTKAA